MIEPLGIDGSFRDRYSTIMGEHDDTISRARMVMSFFMSPPIMLKRKLAAPAVDPTNTGELATLCGRGLAPVASGWAPRMSVKITLLHFHNL